jgi:hypothetical protein
MVNKCIELVPTLPLLLSSGHSGRLSEIQSVPSFSHQIVDLKTQSPGLAVIGSKQWSGVAPANQAVRVKRLVQMSTIQDGTQAALRE